MDRKVAFALAAVGLGGMGALAMPAHAADLTVKVSELRNSDGVVQFALFAAAEGYPKEGDKAVRKGSAPITEKTATFKIDGLAPGNYALSLIHDENKNEKLDTGLFGIPTEGVGASNNAKGSFGPPKFEDAKFDVETKPVTQDIKMMYVF